MAEFITVPIETDPDVLSENAYDRLGELFPGWEPNRGNFEAWLIEVMARMIAEARDVASAVPAAVFRYAGETLFNLPPIQASQATGQITITVQDVQGYTIPQGTNFAIRDDSGELVAFQLLDDAVVFAGQTSVSDCWIQAIEEGSQATNLSGAIELLDVYYSFVTGVTLQGPTVDGVDQEDDDIYLNRLATELQLLSPRPILARDAAIMAQNIPGVERALAIDNYIPAGPGGVPPANPAAERAITIIPIGSDGQPVSQAVDNAVIAYLSALREVNFIFSTSVPTYSLVDVTFELVAYEGFDLADLHTRVIDAIEAFLDPTLWGTAFMGEQRGWTNTPKVRIFELATAINNVEGVNWLTSLTAGIHGGAAQAATDLNLPGVAPLPEPNLITGAVDAP